MPYIFEYILNEPMDIGVRDPPSGNGGYIRNQVIPFQSVKFDVNWNVPINWDP